MHHILSRIMVEISISQRLLGKFSIKSHIKVMMMHLTLIAFSAMPVIAAEYKVGLMLPFSSPQFKGLAQNIEDGFKMGIEHFKSQVSGHDIMIINGDTQASAVNARIALNLIIERNKPDFLAGFVSSDVASSLRDYLHQAGIATILSLPSHQALTSYACSPYIFRASFSQNQMVQPMGQWIFEQGIKTIHLMAPDYPVGREAIKAFKDVFEKLGGQVIGETYPPLTNTDDYAPYLTAAKSGDPDAIYAFFTGRGAIEFVKQYELFGLKEDIPLYGPDLLATPMYGPLQGQAVNGIMTAVNYSSTSGSEENVKFRVEFTQTYPTTDVNIFHLFGYDTARMIIEAIKIAGDDKSRVTEAMKNIKFNSPRGEVYIDPLTHNLVQPIHITTNIYNGQSIEQKILRTFSEVKDEPNGCAF